MKVSRPAKTSFLDNDSRRKRNPAIAVVVGERNVRTDVSESDRYFSE